MKELIKQIVRKELIKKDNEKIFGKNKRINNYDILKEKNSFDNNHIKEIYNNDIFINNNLKTPNKTNKIISHTVNSDVIEKLDNILNERNVSSEYKRKILNLFKNFINYLINNKHNKELITNYKRFNKYIIRRIKISDVNDYINDNYKNAEVSTIESIKYRMRRFIRIINQEKYLDYSEKIKRYKPNNSSSITKDELISIFNYINQKNDLLEFLLFYFFYFIGLNYSFIARILIKDFKSSFKSLILRKGKKRIRHNFPPIISKILYLYFINSRSYNSLYFFEDNFKNNNEESRAMKIKKTFIIFLNNVKNISEFKKKFIISKFSKLRKAKVLTDNLFDLFISDNLKNEIISKLKNLNGEIYEDNNNRMNDNINEQITSNNFDNESNKFETFTFESINNDYKYNSVDNEIIMKEENICEDSSLYMNFEDLMKRYNDFKGINHNKMDLRKRTKDNSTKEFLSHKRTNNLLSLISETY